MSHCCTPKRKKDLLLWTSLSLIGLAMLAGVFLPHSAPFKLGVFAHAITDLMGLMWWGILIGVIAVGLVDRIPREIVIAMIGRKQNTRSLMNAIAAGVLLDMCNHGILMIGAKLYERGASLGQVFAFLIASPWNSFSVTLIIWALMGWEWMLIFLIASVLIALLTGLIIEKLEAAGYISPNPNRIDVDPTISPAAYFKNAFTTTRITPAWVRDTGQRAWNGSGMILRWIAIGILLGAALQTYVPTNVMETWFGPTLAGLGLTLLAATIIEICSEGSSPIAADLMTRGQAPGNAFTFLMAGVATDYTEIMILRETTKSLAKAMIMPLITVPQIVLIGYILNTV